jgi:uncharacterized protein (TIGR02246 family)
MASDNIQSDKRDCELACARLCIDFAWAVDTLHYDAFVDLFIPDGVFERPGLVCQGHAEIRRFLDSRPTKVTRHLCSNIRIEMSGPDAATGSCHATMYQAQEAPEAPQAQDAGKPPRYAPPLVVEWTDDFVRTPHGWKFKQRRTAVILQP